MIHITDIWWCPCRPLSAQSTSELEPDNNNNINLVYFSHFRVNKMKFDNEMSLMEEPGEARY